MGENRNHRTAPSDMPKNAPPQRKNAFHEKLPPHDILPKQRPVTDDEVIDRTTPRWKKILVRVLAFVLIAIALTFGYIFLLLGEPDEEAKLLPEVAQERIGMPMSALESPGETNVHNLADTFGQPVLALYGAELTMEKARIFDTAFGGGYARRVTLNYTFSDGSILTAESIRPTGAATLLGGAGYRLHGDSIYALGGLNAARMDNAQQICIFGQDEKAVYAITCPLTHEEELSALLKQTTLISSAITE